MSQIRNTIETNEIVDQLQFDIKEDESGIEIENESENETIIEEPFDPKKVQFDTKPITIDGLIKRLKYGEINLLPDFQRRPDLWNEKKQSQLIESILMRIPIPVFFFDGKEDGKWQVIDGLQRLTTLKNFIIEKNLKLQNLEYLINFKDYIFDDLPRDLQRRIEETQVFAYIMREDTPEQVKYNVFKRINTGGLVLEPQEIRHALNQGVPANFVKELSELNEFKDATCNSISPSRMKDRDLVTRFISFYLTSYQNYKPEPDLDSFLNKGMASIKNLPDKNKDLLKNKFILSMVLSKDIFGEYAFRKIKNINLPRNPINKALFEAISVCLAQFDNQISKSLIKNRDFIISDFIVFCNNEDFDKSISYATADVKRVMTRFDIIKNLFKRYSEQ